MSTQAANWPPPNHCCMECKATAVESMFSTSHKIQLHKLKGDQGEIKTKSDDTKALRLSLD